MPSHLASLLLAFTSLASAWMPLDNHDKDVFAFNATQILVPRQPDSASDASAQWLPASGKIRGVNLGSLFVIEPWMLGTDFGNMGCGGGVKSEFDCVSKLGQSQANTVFAQHWDSFITQDDIRTMAAYGLNTIRVPLGYWMVEDTVDRKSENFPTGGLAYLDRLVGWASDQGFFIILGLHGAPGAQVAQQPFTGQNAPSPGFYNSYNYGRAYQFLDFMTNRIHTNNAYRNVGMLEVVNEPISGQSSMISEYYPNAYNTIRNRENQLGVSSNNYVHVQFMNKNWGSGDPNQNLPGDRQKVAYDAHIYPKYDPSQQTTQSAYLSRSCNEVPNSDGDDPVIVGEWSISPADSVEQRGDFEVNDGNNSGFYRKWWAAQVMSYEKTTGWIFWSWKTQLGNDYRWSYKQAVESGVIPQDPNQAYSQGAC